MPSIHHEKFRAELRAVSPTGTSEDGLAFFVPVCSTTASSNSSSDHRHGGIGIVGSDTNGQRCGRIDVGEIDAFHDGLFDATRSRHERLMITLHFVRHVDPEGGWVNAGVWCAEDDYFEECVEVHLYDVVDRLLISILRDSTRHSYMRVFENSLRVVHLLSYSLFVMFRGACNIRHVRD